MSILVLDGFESERTSTAFLRRYTGSTGIDTTFLDEPGRLGGKSLKTTSNKVIKVPLPSTASSNLIVGLGIYFSYLSDSVDFPMIIIYGAADVVVSKLSIFTATGEDGFRLKVERNTSAGFIEELSLKHILAFGYWYYIEVDFKPITDESGTWVKVNHDTEIISASVDETVVAGFERMEIDLQPELSGYIKIDDFYIDDANFLDPRYWIQSLSPVSDTEVTWVPFGEATNFEAIDDAADNYSVDDDTTYVSAEAGSDTDAYRFNRILNSFSQPPAVRYAIDGKSTSGSLPLTPIFDGVDRTQLTLTTAYTQEEVVLQDGEVGTIVDLQDMETGFRAS